MRRVFVVLLATVVAAALGGAARDSAAVAKAPPRANAVLAITGGNAVPRLAWLDPETLKRLPGRSLELPYGAWSPVFSPSGGLLALGGGGPDGVRIVDVHRVKIVARVARRVSDRSLTPLSWPEPRRLLVLDRPRQASGPEELLSIDPLSRRVVGRTRLGSTEHWAAWATAGKQLVALVARSPELPRMVAYGPGGGVLHATDVSIPAGTVTVPGGADGRVQYAQPGLAVDPARRRAFVVDGETIATIDLGSFEVSYSRLARPRSVVSRLLGWLEPAAHAKVLSGSARTATWLGDDLLAFSGSTYEETRSVPTGLQLVRVSTGESRTIEPRASGHTFAGGLLVAFGTARELDTNASTGMGASAFAADGTRLWSTLGSEPVAVVETAAGYGYVPTPAEAFPQGVRVLDLSTGSVLRTVRGELPIFVERR